MSPDMTGADLIAAFIAKHCFPKVFLVTGGACAFIVDAVARNESLDYVCVQHEQAAAMAADAIWRVNKQVGVTIATSGPGATNLITGIACSWFDSIPSLHITGQVNQRESSSVLGAAVRQVGFQETDIVSMIKPITKLAIQVRNTNELAHSLSEAWQVATSGRMGPVLIDVPMDVQQSLCTVEDIDIALSLLVDDANENLKDIQDRDEIEKFLIESTRPLFIFGAGLAFGEKTKYVEDWCSQNHVPYCASWGGLPFVDRDNPLFQGGIGVYGSRQANWAIQSADHIVVLGSRLDNRQRTGDPETFAPFAKLLVIDIDGEELAKYRNNERYQGIEFDLSAVEQFFNNFSVNKDLGHWIQELELARASMDSGFEVAVSQGGLSPYEIVPEIQKLIDNEAIVIADTGATLCWVYQSFEASKQILFTAGGNSPMGYALPAAIGAKVAMPHKQVICFIGDGGIQMNIQELQTVKNYGLDIKIIIMNNHGYGMIKQFQDAYFDSRYEATGRGYSHPDFGTIASAYGLRYRHIKNLCELQEATCAREATLIDVELEPNVLITPKVEMNRFIHDQFPYGSLHARRTPLFKYPSHPSDL